jgi:hypothetical protein
MNWLPPLQLPPLQLRPLQLRPLQLRALRLPPRLNVAPPRDGIDMCPWPWPWPPPPRRGAAFTGDAVNVTAANQLKENMSFAFIERAFLFSAFLDFSTREKISGHSLMFISTHTYCSDAGRFLLKCAQILPHGFDLETVAHACVALLFQSSKNCSRTHGSLKLPTLPHAFSITLPAWS